MRTNSYKISHLLLSFKNGNLPDVNKEFRLKGFYNLATFRFIKFKKYLSSNQSDENRFLIQSEFDLNRFFSLPVL